MGVSLVEEGVVSSLTRVRWQGVVETRGDALSAVPETGDVVLVSRSGTDRWLVFRCPCGCGTELPINLDKRTGPAWKLYYPGSQASLYPSVWRESGCEAHFILSRGRVWLLGGSDDDWSRDTVVDEVLLDLVRQTLTDVPAHYFDIAEQVGAEPWETYEACRRLVRQDEAEQGRGSKWGLYNAKLKRR